MKSFIVALILTKIYCDELSIEQLVNQQLPGAVTSKIALFNNTLPVKDQLINTLRDSVELIKNNTTATATNIPTEEYKAKLKNITDTIENFSSTSNLDSLFFVIDQLKDYQKDLTLEAKVVYEALLQVLIRLADYVKRSNVDLRQPLKLDNIQGDNFVPPKTVLVCAATQCNKDGRCVDKAECEDDSMEWITVILISLGLVLVVVIGVLVFLSKKRMTCKNIEYMPQVNSDY
jgi:hypothetical protein